MKTIGNLIASAIREVDIAARCLGDVYAVVFTMSEKIINGMVADGKLDPDVVRNFTETIGNDR